MSAPVLPVTMRAAVWTGPGEDARIERIPVPVPRDGEVLVRVEACGVCHTDLHVMRGEVAFPAPAVLGHEISGVVVAFGGEAPAPADGLEVGSRVVGAFIMPCGECRACLAGRDDMCLTFFALNRTRGVLYDGESRLRRADGSPLAMYSMAGLAEYAVVPATALAPLPETVPTRQAAILGCAGLTAYGAVHHAGEVRPGDAVAVIAIGGVGSSIVQMAAAAGARTIVAVDLDADKLALARRLGATHVVDARGEEPVAAVRALTDGEGVDVAFEALGLPGTFAQATRMIAAGGRMVAVGIAAGAATAEVEITPLVRRGLSVRGSFGGRTRADLPEVVSLAASGDFALEDMVTREYPLAEVARAFRDLGSGGIRARAIVTMGEESGA
jgi:Zn-dependent alcohol dehydrogenase